MTSSKIEQGAVLAGRLPHAVQVAGPRGNDARVAHDRLHDHAGHLLPLVGEERLERVEVVPAADEDVLDRPVMPAVPGMAWPYAPAGRSSSGAW